MSKRWNNKIWFCRTEPLLAQGFYRGSHPSPVLKHFSTFTGIHLYWSLFSIKLQVFNIIKKDSNTHVFSCEYCKIFQNTYFEKHLQTVFLLSVTHSSKHLERNWVKFVTVFTKYKLQTQVHTYKLYWLIEILQQKLFLWTVVNQINIK